MKLHYRTMGKGKPLIILHGVFGSSDNWQTLGRYFAEWCRVFLVDLRDHGFSPHSDSLDLDVMAGDLKELFEDEGIQEADIIGHSMGGKVAMHFAQLHPEQMGHLIVVDMAPKRYEMRHGKLIEALKSLDLERIKGRKDADRKLAERIPEEGVRQFLLKNLHRKGKDEWEWKMNLPLIERDLPKINEPLDEKPVAIPAHFIRGGNSDYIEDGDEELLKRYFPKAELKTVEGSGHWVHAEAPKTFYQLTEDLLRE
ncbi:MAG: alpha/beta fold hydrolase [Flavobacteriales bacterium]